MEHVTMQNSNSVRLFTIPNNGECICYHSSLGGKDAQDVVSEYQAALSLGRRGGDCDRLFPRCPAPSPLLVDQFQTMKIVEH